MKEKYMKPLLNLIYYFIFLSSFNPIYAAHELLTEKALNHYKNSNSSGIFNTISKNSNALYQSIPKISFPTFSQPSSKSGKATTENSIEKVNLIKKDLNRPNKEPISSMVSLLKQSQTPLDINTNKIITQWLNDYDQSTSNIYIQKNLEESINDILFSVDKNNKTTHIKDSTVHISDMQKTLKALKKQYEHNADVVAVLDKVIDKINKYEIATMNIPKETNALIRSFYDRQSALSILSMMDIKPEFDNKTGKIKNIPSIEMLLNEAENNPTQNNFNTLHSLLKTIQITKYILDHDQNLIQSSIFLTKSSIKNQLDTFEKNINLALQNPYFDRYQSITLNNILQTTGLGSMTIESIFQTAQQGIKTADTAANIMTSINQNEILNPASYAAIGLSGYARMGIQGAIIDTFLYHITQKNLPETIKNINSMTLQEVSNLLSPSEKTSILNAHITLDNLENKLTMQGEINKFLHGTPQEQIETARKKALDIMINYYYNAQAQQSIMQWMSITPKINKTSGLITNMPSVESICLQAIKNPSKQAYDALVYIENVVDVSIFVSNYQTSTLLNNQHLVTTQLYLYKEMLEQTKINPAILQYKNIFSRAIDNVTSIIPTAQDILHMTTGIMDHSVQDLAYNPKTISIVNTTLNLSGMKNKPIQNLLVK